MIIGIGRERGLKSIYCVVLMENIPMINLTKRWFYCSEVLRG